MAARQRLSSEWKLRTQEKHYVQVEGLIKDWSPQHASHTPQDATSWCHRRNAISEATESIFPGLTSTIIYMLWVLYIHKLNLQTRTPISKNASLHDTAHCTVLYCTILSSSTSSTSSKKFVAVSSRQTAWAYFRLYSVAGLWDASPHSSQSSKFSVGSLP